MGPKIMEGNAVMMCAKWHRPPVGVVKLTVDGSFHEHEDCMTGVGLIRDDRS